VKLIHIALLASHVVPMISADAERT